MQTQRELQIKSNQEGEQVAGGGLPGEIWGEETAGLSGGELEQMRNFISDRAGDCTSALHCLITAFNRDVSFLTDRPTKPEIYSGGMKHLSPSHT